MKSTVRYLAVLSMVAGWTLVLMAANTPVPNDTDTHLAFTWMVLGGFLSFMGIFAGISRWVAEPAARKIMSEHTRMGASAHPELMPQRDYDTKHTELMEEVNDIKVMIAEMSGRSAGMSRERST